METFKGAEVGRYKIGEKIGDGGLAVVYKATDTHLDTQVAIKFLMLDRLSLTASDIVRKRFKMEAQKMAQLSHANIVRVTDFGVHQGIPFLVMPYMAGGSLDERLGKPIPWRDTFMMMRPIVEALSYTHNKNMVHRDIKPSNILITESGQPMLSDFGIVKILESEETMDLTGTSLGMGTAEYMAPEQADSLDVDARADIYALGVVLYEMIAGQKPYPAGKDETAVSIMIRHARDPLPPIRGFVPSLPEEVEAVVEITLEKEAINRYQDMRMLLDAMTRCLGMGIVPLPPDEIQPDKPFIGIRQFGKRVSLWFSNLPNAGKVALIVTFLLAITSPFSVPMIMDQFSQQSDEITTTPEPETPQEDQATSTPDPTQIPTTIPLAICETGDKDLIPENWQNVFCQSFGEDTDENDWTVQDISERVAQLTHEVYRGHLGVRANVTQATGSYITASPDGLRDFMFSVEGNLNSYSGNPNHEWGVILKESADGYYIFKINEEQRYVFQLVRGDTVTNIFTNSLPFDILPLEEINRITVKVDNYNYLFYINGEFAGEVKDNRLVEGKVGMYMEMNGNSTVDWEFDNIAIYTP